jgi:hypothetical protein
MTGLLHFFTAHHHHFASAYALRTWTLGHWRETIPTGYRATYWHNALVHFRAWPTLFSILKHLGLNGPTELKG